MGFPLLLTACSYVAGMIFTRIAATKHKDDLIASSEVTFSFFIGTAAAFCLGSSEMETNAYNQMAIITATMFYCVHLIPQWKPGGLLLWFFVFIAGAVADPSAPRETG